MQVGITGSHGFIGSQLYKKLKNFCDCKPFDRSKNNLSYINSMKEFVENKDFIFHLAGANRASDKELMRINTTGTLNLLEAIRKYSDAETRIIFASSLQVYGFQKKLILLDEEDLLKPDNAYGISKKNAEDIICRYSEYYGVKALIFRISNVYGEGCRPNYNSVIATYIDQMRKEQRLIVNGTGEQMRDYIYIHDLIEAFLRVFDYGFDRVNIINICTGIPISVNQIVSTLEEIVVKPIMFEHIKSDQLVTHLVGNPAKAMNVLGYTSQITLREGLDRAIKGEI
jgi:nucleoside-diphosphate-sugar epimerase